MIAVGFLFPLFTIPQAATIWVNKSVEGISLITWLSYLIAAILWLVYGILHKEKALIITWTLMSIINFIIVTGIIIFG